MQVKLKERKSREIHRQREGEEGLKNNKERRVVDSTCVKFQLVNERGH